MATDFDAAQHFEDTVASTYDEVIRFAIPGDEVRHGMARAQGGVDLMERDAP